MSDSEARMRYPRGMREGTAVDAPLKDTHLAVGYGELLADGAARIQQKTYTGDNLPRDSFGSLLEVTQQMAAEIAERRNGLDPGAYTTDRTQGMREPGPIAEPLRRHRRPPAGHVGAEQREARQSDQGHPRQRRGDEQPRRRRHRKLHR